MALPCGDTFAIDDLIIRPHTLALDLVLRQAHFTESQAAGIRVDDPARGASIEACVILRDLALRVSWCWDASRGC